MRILSRLLVNRVVRQEASYTLKSVQISCGQPLTPTATVTLVDKNDNEFCACSIGTGPVDALYRAVNEIVDIENDLSEFSVQSVSRAASMHSANETIRVTAADWHGLHRPWF